MKLGKNMFPNIEFGTLKDANIKSTMLGTAVRNPSTGRWYVYDNATNTRKDIMGIKFGEFPVLILPTPQLISGDLIKRDGHYYYIQSVNTAEKTFTGIDAQEGTIQTKLLDESIVPGFNFYSKIVAFDAKTLMDPTGNQSFGGNIISAVLMMNMMNGENDGAEFSLDKINDESFNGLGPYLLMASQNKAGGNLFSNADGTPNVMAMMGLMGTEGNDMTKFMLLSSLMNGNSNPFGNIQNMFTTPVTEAPATLVCLKCGKQYTAETKFCPACGNETKPIAKVSGTCTNCGATLPEEACFCPKCGTKVVPTICLKCGAKVNADDMFCAKCGAPLKENPVEVKEVTEAAEK